MTALLEKYIQKGSSKHTNNQMGKYKSSGTPQLRDFLLKCLLLLLGFLILLDLCYKFNVDAMSLGILNEVSKFRISNIYYGYSDCVRESRDVSYPSQKSPSNLWLSVIHG